ncbi:MAG: hypothetical protein OET90_07265 [Desulfuromonadales bacterium]|nr:hypothetical protein [Desulfuromonadales bacterium]
MTMPLRFLLLLALLLLLAFGLAGCGKKGPVRPKLATPPPSPQNVSLHQRGADFLLSWDAPSAADDLDLAGYRIRRLSYNAIDGCPTCRDPEESVAKIELKYPAPAQLISGRLYWFDPDVQQGRGYRYQLLPFTTGQHLGDAVYAHQSVFPVVDAPVDLTINPQEGRLRLQWRAPVLAQGMELLGYNLYRWRDGASIPAAPLNPQPLQRNWLVMEASASNDEDIYCVSALIESNQTIIEGTLSNAISFRPSP